MNGILEKLVGRLPAKLQPYAKALTSSALAVIAVLVEFGASGKFNSAELYTAGMGAISASVAYLVPNLPTVAKDAIEAVATGIEDAEKDAAPTDSAEPTKAATPAE